MFESLCLCTGDSTGQALDYGPHAESSHHHPDPYVWGTCGACEPYYPFFAAGGAQGGIVGGAAAAAQGGISVEVDAALMTLSTWAQKIQTVLCNRLTPPTSETAKLGYMDSCLE